MKAKLSLKARQHLLTEANADAKQMQVVVDDQLAALSQLEREQQQLIRAKKKAEAAKTKDAGKPKTAPKAGDEKQGESKWTAKQQTELDEVRGTTVIGRGVQYVCACVFYPRALCLLSSFVSEIISLSVAEPMPKAGGKHESEAHGAEEHAQCTRCHSQKCACA
jgi:hypothetical protein